MLNKHKYFYRIFIPFLLVGMQAVVVFGIFTYFHSRNLLNDIVHSQTNENLLQISNTIEQKFQSLDTALHSFLTDSWLLEMIEEPFDQEDFIRYRQLMSSLNFISTFGNAQTEIDVISFEGRWMIQGGTLRQLSLEELEELEVKYTPSINKINRQVGARGDELQLVRSIPWQPNNHSGIVVIRMPSQAITNVVNREITPERPLFITNSDGDIIYQSLELSSLGIESTIFERASERRGSFNFTAEDQNETMIYIRSFNYGLHYFTFGELGAFDTLLQSILVTVALISSAFLFISMFIGYLVSNEFSKPVLSLSQLISKDEKKQHKLDFQVINNSVKEIIHANESLQNVLMTQMEQLKSLFIINLFYGVIDDEDIPEKLKQFNYPQDFSVVHVCTVQIDFPDSISCKDQSNELILFAVNEIIKEIIPLEISLTPTVIDPKTQVTILLHKDTNELSYGKIKKYFIEVQNRINQEFDISISVGISSSHSCLVQTKAALKQSREALKHRLNKGKGTIIFHNEITMDSTSKDRFHYPTKLGNHLIEVLKKGHEEEAMDILNQLLAEIYKRNKGLIQFELSIFRLLNEMINLMNFLRIDNLATYNQQAFYSTISEFSSPEELEKYIKENIFEVILKTVADRENKEFKNLSEEILHIIQNEFEAPLTLELIGNRLHYNPNYLSGIFKKAFDLSFSEYLTHYRHTMAKKWLLETNMTIKEISERLQYNNPQNFIRSFKKFEGIPPGKYREENKIHG